ncbi:MAG TPA: hypothetical protein VFQ45_05475 [Longimicrobium sp.]|nr:hypothetical protein [Longimicrobium sp.]
MHMKELALYLVVVLAGLSSAVVLVDAGGRLLRWWKRRRVRKGAVGVVIDREGNVLGTYVDPFADPWRNPRMHGPESPWVPAARWGETAMAWEGFGENAEQARQAANRLRRRHLQYFGLLEAGADEDETDPGLLYPPPGV